MENLYKEFNGKRVTLMGLGKFGGGMGAAKFLAENGAQVTVTDLKTESELSDSIADLKGYNIKFVLGKHDPHDFVDIHMIVVNPAVPRSSDFLWLAKKFKIKLTTEISLFASLCPAPICAITGSNGKTTTVSMLKSILDKDGIRYLVGGNIGGSLLLKLPEIGKDDKIILELSSFQLEWLNEIKWRPHISAILNILPNHLDRHITYRDYLKAKSYIALNQKTGDTAILNYDDEGSRSIKDLTRARTLWVGKNLPVFGFSLEDDGNVVFKRYKQNEIIFPQNILKIPGTHNLINAAFAAACARTLQVKDSSIINGLKSFKGVPHRLEYIGKKEGVSFYNDSKATTPEAATVGVLSFPSGVIPILGGYDKGLSFDNFAKEVSGKVKWAAVIGVTAPKISESLKNVGIEHDVFSTLGDAFKSSLKKASNGDKILLSPGCASYDMFSNYEERGDVFREMVTDYIEGK